MAWLLAKIYDRFMESSERACLQQWRRELFRELRGTVLEIGAGTGRSLGLYPDGVERLVLAEPDAHMRAQLDAKLSSAGAGRAEVVADEAESLSFADGSFDAVVSSMVLCSVADPAHVLAEVRRVLAPGGRLVFLEHVAAEDRPSRLRWQRRLEPLWKRVAGNCHVTRRTLDTIEQAGFEVAEVERESIRKANPLTRPSIRGYAVKPE